MYSRLGYFALKTEVTENTAVIPDVFLGITAFDVVTDYLSNPSSPIFMDRNTKINPVKGPIDAPQGTVGIQIEPKGVGYFLKAVFGAVTSGRYFPISSVTGTFAVGDVVTGGTSAATATVLAVSSENDYLIMGAPTGTFTAAGEAITAPGGKSATLGVNASTVYGHEFKAPQTTLPTFTVEVGYDDMAVRLTGVRFPSINSLTQDDNIMGMELAVFAMAEFKHARVTTAVTSGAGAKTIPLDQTLGLVATDTIKVFRPSTGAFLDFASSGVKTHTIGSVSAGASVAITNLQTSLAVGDLIVLGNRTPSYSLAKEMSWIGGSVARVADTMTLALTASAALANIESFEMAITNEMEARHAALATGVAGRFPSKNHLKGFMGNGTLRRAYLDQSFLDRLRNATKTCLNIRHTGDQIASTSVYYTLDWRMPNCIFSSWQPAFESDALLEEEMPFDFYRETSPAYTSKALLVTDATTYA